MGLLNWRDVPLPDPHKLDIVRHAHQPAERPYCELCDEAWIARVQRDEALLYESSKAVD